MKAKKMIHKKLPLPEKEFSFLQFVRHRSVFHDLKVVFPDTAERALEIIRQIFPLGSRGNSIIRVT